MGCILGFANSGKQNPKTLLMREDSCNPEIHISQITEGEGLYQNKEQFPTDGTSSTEQYRMCDRLKCQ